MVYREGAGKALWYFHSIWTCRDHDWWLHSDRHTLQHGWTARPVWMEVAVRDRWNYHIASCAVRLFALPGYSKEHESPLSQRGREGTCDLARSGSLRAHTHLLELLEALLLDLVLVLLRYPLDSGWRDRVLQFKCLVVSVHEVAPDQKVHCVAVKQLPDRRSCRRHHFHTVLGNID